MGVEHLRIELAEEVGELIGIVIGGFVQTGAGDELVTQAFNRPAQRQHPHTDAATTEFGQFAGDERLGEFWEDVDDVGNAVRGHGAFPALARLILAAMSERASSTARLALWSQ